MSVKCLLSTNNLLVDTQCNHKNMEMAKIYLANVMSGHFYNCFISWLYVISDHKQYYNMLLITRVEGPWLDIDHNEGAFDLYAWFV